MQTGALIDRRADEASAAASSQLEQELERRASDDEMDLRYATRLTRQSIDLLIADENKKEYDRHIDEDQDEQHYAFLAAVACASDESTPQLLGASASIATFIKESIILSMKDYDVDNHEQHYHPRSASDTSLPRIPLSLSDASAQYIRQQLDGVNWYNIDSDTWKRMAEVSKPVSLAFFGDAMMR